MVDLIAWDIAVTEDGFEIIEMNASSGPTVIQVHDIIEDIEGLSHIYSI